MTVLHRFNCITKQGPNTPPHTKTAMVYNESNNKRTITLEQTAAEATRGLDMGVVVLVVGGGGKHI